MPHIRFETQSEDKNLSENRTRFATVTAVYVLLGIMNMLYLVSPSIGYTSNHDNQGGALSSSKKEGNMGSNVVNQKPAADSPKIVLIGASYAQDWDLTHVNDIGIINKGMSGQQTGEVLSRFESDVVKTAPKAVIIWGFINDIFRGAPDHIEDVKKRAMTNIEAMVQKAKSGGILPIVATEVTIRAKKGIKEALVGFFYGTILRRPSYQQYINTHVQDINAWLRNYAEKEGIILLDFEKVLSDDSGIRQKDYATDDGSHISKSGYRALTDYLNNHSRVNQLILSRG